MRALARSPTLRASRVAPAPSRRSPPAASPSASRASRRVATHPRALLDGADGTFEWARRAPRPRRPRGELARVRATPSFDPSPPPPPPPPRDAAAAVTFPHLAALLKCNACVELVGGVAVFADPETVFPGVASVAAALECTRWYALTLCCLALASFLASRDEDRRRRREGGEGGGGGETLPLVAGMAAYHVGVSLAQAPRVLAGSFGIVAWGALGVHAPLAACFVAATLALVRAEPRDQR